MTNKKIKGNLGEEIATEYIKGKNYLVLKNNFNCRQGEIDIVAKDKNELVFIEVKTREFSKYVRPIEAINKCKMERIVKAAKYYIFLNEIEECQMRFDAIEVILKNKSIIEINHVKNIY